MPPALRKFVLAVHLTVSVGWIGAIAAYIPFDVATVTSRDAQSVRGAYLAMESIARSVIVPLALASLLTGLVVSLGTKWGLFRHYWVLISLVLTTLATVVLLLETRTIGALAGMAADPTMSGDDIRALPSTLGHSVGGTVVLVVVLVLHVYKPRGMTRYGWRKEQHRTSRGRAAKPGPSLQSSSAPNGK
jgi:SNF family Na+-dependent transporter